MTQQEFHNDLNRFIRETITLSSDRDDIRVVVVVHLQPNMTILSGEYFIECTGYPVDLRTITKAKRRQIVEKIRTYHWNTTEGGVNKWNLVSGPLCYTEILKNTSFGISHRKQKTKKKENFTKTPKT